MTDFIFCILKTPFISTDNDFTIFITKNGLDYLECSTKNQKGYKKIQSSLKKIGYSEIDELRFEYIINNYKKISRPSFQEIVDCLVSLGIEYSIELEKVMFRDLTEISKFIQENSISELFKNYIPESTLSRRNIDLLGNKEEGVEMIKKETVQKRNVIPSIGDKIELNFYLLVYFLYFKESEEFKIDLSGCFISEKKTDNKFNHVIKIVTENFERIPHESMGKLCFKSTRTKGDLLKEISFLYEFSVDLTIHKKTKDNKEEYVDKENFVFDYFNIKDEINENERIILTVDIPDYVNMLFLSKNIKDSSEKHKIKNMSYKDVEYSFQVLKDELNQKMISFADEEEYLKASNIQKDLSKIETKMKENLMSQNEKISLEDFHNIFNLK